MHTVNEAFQNTLNIGVCLSSLLSVQLLVKLNCLSKLYAAMFKDFKLSQTNEIWGKEAHDGRFGDRACILETPYY